MNYLRKFKRAARMHVVLYKNPTSTVFAQSHAGHPDIGQRLVRLVRNIVFICFIEIMYAQALLAQGFIYGAFCFV